MTHDIKPCPFCGSQPYAAKHTSYGWWSVICKCGAEGPSFRAPENPDPLQPSAGQNATAAWNERAAPSDLSAAIASAREEGYQECLRIFGNHMRGIASLHSQ